MLPLHWYKALKLIICTVKPSAVAVGVPNVGVNAVFSEVASTVAEPVAYPARLVVIVTIELVPAAKPSTVNIPLLPLKNTDPDVTVPAHV